MAPRDFGGNLRLLRTGRSGAVRPAVGPAGPAGREGGREDRGDAMAIVAASPRLTAFREQLWPTVREKLPPGEAQRLPRKDIAFRIGDIVMEMLDAHPEAPDLFEQRHLVTVLINDLMTADPGEEATPPAPRAVAPAKAAAPCPPGEVPPPEPPAAEPEAPPAEPVQRTATDADTLLKVEPTPERPGPQRRDLTIEEAKRRIRPLVMERIDVVAASKLDPETLERELSGVVAEIRAEIGIQMNKVEHGRLVGQLVDDMVGLGPLEPLLEDEAVTDIMVNGPNQVYIERGGKLELTDIVFQDDTHVMNIATRIVTRVGRRVDESSPICDARLADGSRVNVIAQPLAIDGCTISIRKFSKKRITLDHMAQQGNLSPQMARLLKIAARSRLNIVISGGTGSGKTTLLNALSQLIDHGERIVTVEDAAELQLQQPHVVRLETRPPNLEGHGEVTMRDLVKNSLRMRPDRIILGEVRGAEAIDMLQAMNTGHEGSMCTLHANRPRDTLIRMENMVGMAGMNLPQKAIRTQMASAVDLIVQISRMRDGKRRITNIVEVVGMEGDIITTQELYSFEFKGEDASGRILGEFRSTGLRPAFLPKAEYFGLGQALMEVL